MLDRPEPLKPHETKALVRSIIAAGTVHFSPHAAERIAERSLVGSDVLNVLRAGQQKGFEWKEGTCRYQIGTPHIVVVILFESETELVVVTVWRIER